MTEHETLSATQTDSGKKKRKHKKKKRQSTNAVTTNTRDQPEDDDVNAEKQVVTNPPMKRSASDDDSDEEQVVKKKKKKKNKSMSTETTGKKGAKSIRQLKREKHAQRLAEAESSAKSALKEQCLSYLSQWKHDKQNWKFMKAKQAWLYRNKFSSKLIPDELWPLFLEYFSSAHGNIKKMLLEDANKVISKIDECLEKEQTTPIDKEQQEQSAEEPQQTEESEKPDEASYKRARDIIQHLEE